MTRRSRDYIGNSRHAVVRPLRLALADLLNMLVQLRRLLHQSVMDLVIYSVALWPVMEVKVRLGLLPLRHKISNRDPHSIKCLNLRRDYSKAHHLLNLRFKPVAILKRLRRTDMVLNHPHQRHLQGLVNLGSTVGRAALLPLS
jgi:hypothetical protein